MNILLMVNTYFPIIGGVENVVENLAKELKKKGHAVCIVTNGSSKSLPHYEIVDGVEVFRVRMGLPNASLRGFFGFLKQFPVSTFRLCKIIRNKKPDVVNVHFISTGNSFYAVLLKKIFRFSLVASVHGADVQEMPEKFWINKVASRNCLIEAELITGCSEHILQVARELAFFDNQKGIVIRNGIDLMEFQEKKKYEHPRPYIFTIGRFVYKKGIDVLIQAFRYVSLNVPCLDLIIAGDGEEREKYESIIEELGLVDRVHLIGFVNRATAVQLFNGCEFFVLPSRREPLGVVNLEAMAAGKAIVATRVGGVPEIVFDGENGILVASEERHSLAEAMLFLYRDEGLREQMGQRGQAFVAQEYSWEKSVDQYLGAYHKTFELCRR